MFLVICIPVLVYIKFIYKDPPLPAPRGEIITVEGKVRDKTYDSSGEPSYVVIGDAYCYLSKVSFEEEPEIGGFCRVTGKLYDFKQAMNLGGYDERAYRRVRGQNYRINATGVEIISGKITLREKLCKLKRNLALIIRKYCPLEEGTINTLILADKSSLSDERKDLYRSVSLSHFLVVSGLHVSAVAGVFYKLCRLILKRKIPASAVTLTVLIFYGLLIGFSVSVLRAIFMYAVRLLGDLWGKAYDMLSAASLAATVTLMCNPLYLTDSSFIYSYLAVFSIGFMFEGHVLSGLKGFKNRFKDSIRFSLGMCLVMLPATLYFSGVYSVGAILLNLFIVPMGPLMLFTAFGAFFASLLSLGGVARIFDAAEHILLSITDFTAEIVRNAGLFRISGKPDKIVIFLCYGALLWFLFNRKKWGTAVSDAIAIATYIRVISAVWWWTPCVSMLYVGQGECMVLRTSAESAVVIDCGSTSQTKVCQYDLVPFLNASGIRCIEGIFISHSDKDHTSGISELLEAYRAEGIIVRNLFLQGIEDEKLDALEGVAKDLGIPSHRLSCGDSVKIGDWEFDCFWPYKGVSFDNKNEASMVLLGKYKEFSMLFTGDISAGTEGRLIKACGDTLKADVLKIPHHGSNKSSSEGFLAAVSPEASVISAGIGNRYSHPGVHTTNRLDQAEIPRFCTKETGELDIFLYDRGGKFKINSYISGRIFNK